MLTSTNPRRLDFTMTIQERCNVKVRVLDFHNIFSTVAVHLAAKLSTVSGHSK